MDGRRLIGLYEVGFSGGLFGLRISITTECFQALGKYDSLNNALNKCDKNIMTLRGRFFIMKLVIRSKPGDLLIGFFFYDIIYFSGRSSFGRQGHWERRFKEVFNNF